MQNSGHRGWKVKLRRGAQEGAPNLNPGPQQEKVSFTTFSDESSKYLVSSSGDNGNVAL